jgi:opacity protein-like surface antigen
MRFLKVCSVSLAMLASLSAKAVEFGAMLGVESSLDQETNVQKGSILFQSLFFDNHPVQFYLGVGAGFKGLERSVGNVLINNTTITHEREGVKRDPLLELELGPEFMFPTRARLQVIIGLEKSLGGQLYVMDTAGEGVSSKVSMLFGKVGTRLYAPMGENFDLGIGVAYYFIADKSFSSTVPGDARKFTDNLNYTTLSANIRYKL